VTVTVTSCSAAGITAVPDPISVPRGAWHIQWDLVTPGYAFTANGIQIPDVPIPGTGRKVFEDPQRLTATKFQYKDNDEFPGRYKYKIEVTNGSQTCLKDPDILNN
jgi:hypothetical protein